MRKKVFLVIPILITILCIVLTSFVQANDSEKYAIEIIDDGTNNFNVDDNTSITKNIISSNNTSALYQVKLENNLKKAMSTEMAIVIDTSKSMGINDRERTMYQVASQFVEDMFNGVEDIKISISDTTTVKNAMTNKDGIDTLKTTISNLDTENSNSIDTGIDIAKTTFSSSTEQKVLVIFTDATDKITKVAELEAQGIQVITILTNMTRVSYTVEGVSTVGLTYMMDAINMDYILSLLSKEINNIVVTDVFSEDIIQYFDLEVVEKAENDIVEITDNGYIWKISEISASSFAELQFRLTLKNSVEIDSEKIYQNIQTSEKLTVSYTVSAQDCTYEVTDSPIVMICENYSVTIQAVSVDNTDLPIEGIEFNVTGKDSEGNIIYSNTLKTDKLGNVSIEGVKTTGLVTFTVEPIVNVSGYDYTDTENIVVNNDINKRELFIESENTQNTVDNENRKITVKFPINTKKFTLQVNLTEENNSLVKIEGTEFRLIQPEFENKYEFSALYGETNSSGTAMFTPVVMPKAGTYDYILSQITEHEGYESMGNVTIRITFDENGNMIDIVSKYNKNVTAERKSNSYGIINVQNKNLLTDVFNFELNLKDKDTNYPLEGALYTISVKNDEGELITYSNQKTDINGKINLVLQGSGYIQIKIAEEVPVLGYKADIEEKELIIYRSEGVVQYVVKTTPLDLDAIADSTNNKLIANLVSESENELSVIQVKLTDSKEYDVYVPNVKFTLTSLEEPIEEYTGITNENGIIDFVIQGKPQGVYAYKLTIDNATVPSIYKQIEEEMAVSVTFDENRRLVDISDAKGIFIDFSTDIVEDEEKEKIYHIGVAQIGLEMSEEATTDLEIKLVDDITGEPIVGAGYDISIKAGDIIRNKKGAKTNSQGIVSSKIVTADVVEIEISQVSSAVGYVVDLQKQIIKLEKTNGIYKIVEQSPYDLSDEKNGALIEESKVVFKHANRKKAGSDVKLNLYINKMDKEENLVANIPVRIYSDEIRNSEGVALDTVLYTDDFGYLELEKLIVPEIEIPGEGEYILYITEAEKQGESEQFVDKANTLIELKLAFRYNENKKIVELTNAEPTKGNRLIKDKTFNGYETDECYESNLFLDIYTNYDEYGNFAMNFIKKSTEGEVLNGAKYDVTIMRPNGTNLIRKDLEITDSVEFEGIFVTKGTTIEITEKEAPVGYELSEHTTIIKIVDVNIDTLEVTAEIIDTESGDTKTVIDGVELIPLEDGTIKTSLNIVLVNKELNNFEMGITTIDKVSGLGVRDTIYNVVSSKGFKVETPVSDSEGKTNFKIGGRFSEETISYEIAQIETGEYYKKLKDKIILNVVFDENKEVDNEATMQAQTDPNYGVIWEIDSINVENGNAINIKIKNEPQDPLTVNIETLDAVTLNKIEDISYKIAPSINLAGEGIENINVGYVSPNKTKNYTVEQLTEISTHQTVEQQQIKIVYDKNGDIVGQPVLSDGLELVSYSGKVLNIRIKLEPKVPFTLENVSYFDQSAIINAEFEISLNNEKETIITQTNGIGSGLLGELGTNEEIVYHVHQVKADLGYALVDDFDIRVHYDVNRVIDNVELVKENRFVDVSYVVPSTDTDDGYNGNDKGIIKIKVKSYPELKMNIENVDALDNTKLAGTTYQVVSTLNTKDDEVITEADGIGVAHLDKTAINDIVEYTIIETRPSALYQTMKEEVKIQVAFDDDGYIKSCKVVEGNTFATVSKIENITVPEENFILNIQIKSNKMLKFNIIATDSQNENYVLQNARFSAIATFNEEQISSDEVVTDVDGKAMLKLDRCLESETIIYTIKQTKKNAGYQFPEEDIKIEITYDSNGKIISDSVRLLQGSKYIQILNIDYQNFEIDVKIINEETEEFGVEITTMDKYDNTIKLENVKYEAYLMTSDYGKDQNYTGEATTDQNGDAYIQFGKYNAEYGETRVLRLVESNVPGTHREIGASILVNIKFDENGIITNTTVPSGQNAYVGWVADGRFVKVTYTRYTVIVQIYHYPYLNLSVATEDIYTGERLEAQYKISTSYGPGGYYQNINTNLMQDKIAEVQQKIYQESKENATLEDLISYLSADTSVTKIKRSIDNLTVDIIINDKYTYTVDGNLQIVSSKGPWISTGGLTGYTNIDYIGNGIGEILQADFNTKTDGEYDTKGIGPTEQNSTREYYIYELQEPTSPMQYQKYIPRYLTWYYSRIIGKITIKYDGKGNIESCTVDELKSNNNIDYDFIGVNKLDERNLEIKVKYAPTTTMEVTAIDSVSKEPLSNVRVSPYGNIDYNTRQSYEYRTINYYTTDSDGKTNYTYWGANVNEGQNEYHINTNLMSYKGYYGTGTIKVKVSYDQHGRIAAADIISTDENGMPNAEVVGFENNKLKINILYYRKFNIQINKKDVYDSNMNLLAQFKVVSNKGEDKNINSSSLSLMGIVRPGETVKYTLSETIVPDKYIPLENLEFYVTFNDDGSIRRAWSYSDLFESVYERYEAVKINSQDVKDLEVNIKNEPQLSFKINLVDKFYNEKVLKDVSFSIENDKGDIVTGNPITNSNGILDAVIGKVYPNEKVIYTIKQTSEVNGYAERNLAIKLQVEFNRNGKIENYSIISGDNSVSIDNDKFKNGRHIELTAMLTPIDIKLGIINYNDITKEAIPNVTYKITSQEIEGGSSLKETEIVTNSEGTVIDVVDKFKETESIRIVNYTISEVNIPNTYRKIQDVVIQVRYGEDGRIIASNVLSNPSNVIVKVAIGGRLQYLNGNDVHMLLEIPNNNSYDLIIKNEDINYENLGIEGTIYDISINGESISETTDENGVIRILNRLDSGNIQIRIAENTIGMGYKADNNNSAILDIEKGLEEYSLVLSSNSNPTYADVSVSEEYGVITVVFRNETKSSITLEKDVADVRYNITSKEKQSDGTYINEKFIGNDLADVIAQETLHYELGVTPQNKTIVYSFEEVDVPNDYHRIGIIEITVEYDMYGHINRITDNSDRVDVIENPEGSHDIIVVVSEYVENDDSSGDDLDNKEGYTIKVVSQEVGTNLRINDSVFDIEINQGEGNLIQDLEGQATANIEKKGYVLEKGVIKTDSVNKDGYICVEVNQKDLAEGYIYGNQKTSGTVTLNVEYQKVSGDKIRIPIISVIDNDGLEVTVDNTNREIIIKVYNEPEVIMEILTRFKVKNEDGSTELQPQEGIHYTITSQIQTTTEILDTDLNVTTKETDVKGNTKTSVGMPYAGKSVIYTVKQEEDSSYDSTGDIVILVQYDTKGLVKYYEVLSALDYVEIVGNEGERIISIQITNEKQKYSDTYKVQLEKHHINDEEYGKLIPGVKFKIHVKEEYGEEVEWEAITDEDGLIISKEFSGYGRIQIDITELETISGFKLDGKMYTIKAYRDQKTGKLSIETSDSIAYEFDENYSTIFAKPVNEPRENSHTIVVNKTDLNKNTLITTSTAEFEVTRIEYENQGTEEQPNIVEIPINLGTIVTDEKGKARLENLDSPSEPGTYKYIIKETKAPDGYLISEEIAINITFKHDEEGNVIIDRDTTEILSGDARPISIKDNLLSIAIYNTNIDAIISEDEYSLDITKVDAETNEPIENMAIFKVWLPDENNTAVYTETRENSLGKGKLDYCYIEQDKDYQARLTHMKLPKEEKTLKYVFKEVIAPEGYALIEEELELSIEFKIDPTTNEMYIENIISSNPEYLRVNTVTPCSTDTRIEIDILNGEEKQKEFTIHYDANDNGEGTIVPNDQIKVFGIDTILDSTIPVREGYVFKGWSARQNATVGEYVPGDTYLLEQNITLYAVWEEKLYLTSTEYLIGTGVNPKAEWSPGELSKYEDGDLYIKGIRPQSGIRLYPNNAGTYLDEFLSNLNTNADEIKVYIPEKDQNGNITLKDENVVPDSRLIGTGMIIKLTKEGQEIQLTLIVRGDLIAANSTVGDGKITNVEASRLVKLNEYTLITNYTIEEQQAIDYYINTNNRWSTNKQAIVRAYQEHTLEPIRQEVE